MKANVLSLGVIAHSRKENELRLPIHPEHFHRIADPLRRSIRFETGYGARFGIADTVIADLFGGVASRAELMATSDVVLLPKPQMADLHEMRRGGTLWGWPHCVQNPEITQVAIDRKLTLIAWEAMFAWNGSGDAEMHLFARNNEMAGYCGVIHALGVTGKDGNYGAPATARVISHGSVSRGAIYALLGRGYQDITVYTQRPPFTVRDRATGCHYGRVLRGEDEPQVVEEDGTVRSLLAAMSESDVIVNGILQDTDRPLMFLRAGEEASLRPGTLVIDVSCDLGMGFPFARPTSFTEPTFAVGPVTYYGVDHSPSYLWQASSFELSKVVVPFLGHVMGGPAAWDRDETVRRSIEIHSGVVRNQKILSFQNRAASYPHPIATSSLPVIQSRGTNHTVRTQGR